MAMGKSTYFSDIIKQSNLECVVDALIDNHNIPSLYCELHSGPGISKLGNGSTHFGSSLLTLDNLETTGIRYKAILTEKNPKIMKEQSLETLDQHWNEAKKLEND